MSFCFLTCSSHKFRYCCSDVHDRVESSEKPVNIIESSDPASSVAENENGLVSKLDKLKVDPKER